VRNAQVLEAATSGSAQALGMPHIGRLAPGYAADIVFLDLDAPTLIPLNDPVNQLVMGEDGTSVDAVMIGGRFVVRDQTLLTVDLARLATEAEAARASMQARNTGRRSNFECVAPIITDFCPALAARPWHINRYCGC
jgi:guanine deaminase